jgi:hypothetical protein
VEEYLASLSGCTVGEDVQNYSSTQQGQHRDLHRHKPQEGILISTTSENNNVCLLPCICSPFPGVACVAGAVQFLLWWAVAIGEGCTVFSTNEIHLLSSDSHQIT